jgi:haloacetate dehalogenase
VSAPAPGAPVGHTVDLDGLRVHYLRAGEGAPVLLLHGWPQTSHMWRHVLPALAERRTVIAPDLRGYGRTDAPPGSYDKRTMGGDLRALASALGLGRVALVGHDRGARVAHRWALDHPEDIERVALLDIVPTREVIRRFDASFAGGFWHWLFHMQPDLPELLVAGREAPYLEWFFERWAWRRSALDPDAVAEYARAFARPGRMRAGFDDYRATLTHDVPADEESFAAGQRLEMPVLVLWGQHGLVGGLPVAQIWSQYARDLRAEPVANSGHFLAEEQPLAVVDRLAEFLDEAAAVRDSKGRQT